jgi:hypothetical protein
MTVYNYYLYKVIQLARFGHQVSTVIDGRS